MTTSIKTTLNAQDMSDDNSIDVHALTLIKFYYT